MPALRSSLLATACFCLLSACGGTSQEGAGARPAEPPSSADVGAATASGLSAGAHLLELRIGDARFGLRSDAGGLARGPVHGVDGVDAVSIEVLNPENTVYAKADLFVAAGAPIEGDYRLGLRGSPEVSNVPGRGQVITAIEEAEDRHMRVSGDGTLSLRREGGMLVARFEYSLSAFSGEPLDAPVSGEMRVPASP